ncbi:MAG TPA: alkaline phosphatase family protein [Casimicrobiaceae bacterium]|nr:alkaline phosphatase family protein [Casimicrobiaceae bacterium]
MSAFTRRDFLQAAGALSASAALASCADMLRTEPASKLSDIDHIIILMKENRSFDHYFGTLAGVRGYDDADALMLASGRSVFYQPDEANPDGYVLPFRLDTRSSSAQRLTDLNHSWRPLHACFNDGRMDSFVATMRRFDGDAGPLTMGYMTRDDLPLMYLLADAFTVCDGYHASLMGPTHPNRFFLMTASIGADGRHGEPATSNSGRHYAWETYPERLTRAGITWRIYHDYDDYGCNVVKYFNQYQDAPRVSELRENGLVNRPLYELLHDLATGNLPQVVWIVPPSDASEHPDYLPAAGEHHTKLVLDALWSNPKVWARSVVILNYDENDGQFDHVPPPTPPPGTPGEFIDGLPAGLGFRVPCLVISPWSHGGYVVGDTFDHTSTLRLIETRFGVEVPNLSAWRRATCGDLTAAIGLGALPRYDVPVLPDTAAHLAEVERTVMNLPLPAPPATQSMPTQEQGTRKRRGAMPA